MKKTSVCARRPAFALSVLSAALLSAAHAPAMEIDPVVVTGSRLEQPLSLVLPSVTVMTRDDIEQSQTTSLADLLQGEAGFEFARNGGPGSVTSFFLRGQESKSVLVLLDGVPVQRDGSGSLTLSDFPLSRVERVEVMRGNAGALYGESAIGGVISITTRKGQGPAVAYGSISYGARNTASGHVGYTGAVDDTRFDLQAGGQSTTGFSAMNALQNAGVNPAKDGHERQFAGLRVDQKLAADLTLGLRASGQKSRTDYDSDWYGPQARQQFKVANNALGVSLKQLLSEVWTSNLDMAYADYQYDDLLDGQATTSYSSNLPNGVYKGQQTALRWQNHYDMAPQWKGVFGADRVEEKYKQSNTYQSERQTTGVYLGLNGKMDRFDAQVNVRQDAVDVSREAVQNKTRTTSGLLGLGYLLQPHWRLTATVSTGFRAPTAYETFLNSALNAETHQAKELGVAYNTGHLAARLVYFRTSTRDAIIWQDDTYRNVGRVENQGTEASLRTQWQGYLMKASLVHQDPRNVSDGVPLTRRARTYGSLDLSKKWGAYSVGAHLNASGQRPDMDYAAWPYRPETLAGYAVWNLYASRKLDEHWTARLRLENAFDKSYQLAHGYNTPGRGLFATLQYSPK
jgi:vitamin B12 transporter